MAMAPLFVLYLTCVVLGKIAQMTELKLSSSVHQDSGFISANVGDEVTLECLSEGYVADRFNWYKQTLGQKPRLISTFYKYERNGTLYNEFKNPRFTLDTQDNKNNLMISDLRISDSATYYCINYLYTLEFSETITVSVKGSGLNIQSWVHQSASESIQPGGSVSLSCTVQTGTCDGEHSVYWFRDSKESHPGLIYTHGDRNDQCERKPNTQTHTCVYNLPMENLNPSHAGTYYCAVASCGHILFGNGTKLDFEGGMDCLFMMYFWSGASAFTTLLSVLLAFSVYKINKRNSCPFTDPQATLSSSSRTHSKSCKNGDNLCYIALRQTTVNGSRSQRDDTWSECVYLSVK